MKANSYVLVYGVIFRRNHDGVLLWCFPSEKLLRLFKKCMKGYVEVILPQRLLLTTFLELDIIGLPSSYSFISKCSTCQKFSRWMKRTMIPLQPILVDALFMQWGLDVIGPNNPKSSQGHAYLLNAIDYSTEWK